MLARVREGGDRPSSPFHRKLERHGPRPQRPSSAPSLLRGSRLPAGAKHHSAHPCQPASRSNSRPGSARTSAQDQAVLFEEELPAFRQNLEDVAVADQLSSFRMAYRITQDEIRRVDPMKDTKLFDLKVLHNAVQRKHSAFVSEATKRAAQTNAGSGAGGAGSKKEKVNAEKDSLEAKRLRQICEALDMSTRSACKELDVSHRLLVDLAQRNMPIEVAQALAAGVGHDVEEEAPPLPCDSSFSALRGAFKAMNLEAQRQQDAFFISVPCVRSAVAFLAARGDVSQIISNMDISGTGYLTAQDWEIALTKMAFHEDVMLPWGHLSKGHKQVAIPDLQKSIVMVLEDMPELARLRRKPSEVRRASMLSPSGRAHRRVSRAGTMSPLAQQHH